MKTFDTTAGLITRNGTPQSNEIIKTNGYTISGDGGGATWKHNGVTGQTVSQSPAQLADGLLNDASGNQWALVSNDKINIRALGAVGNDSTDDAPVIQAALNGVMNSGGGVLYAPRGIYVINSLSSSTVDLGIGGEKGFSLFGDGRGVTTFKITSSAGFLKWENTAARDITVTLKDFGFTLAAGGSAGTILEFNSTVGGNHHHRDFYSTNIMSLPDDPLVDYADKFFSCSGLWRPYFSNVTHSGPFGAVSETIQKQGTAVFDLPDCYAPTLEKCYAWGCAFGYRHIVTENPGGEGISFNECVADSDVGFFISSTGGEPAFTFRDCHANCNTAGVRIQNKRLGRIEGLLFYNEESTAYSDIELINCEDVIISNNIYHFSGNTNRIGVNIDANCKRIWIEGEKFKADGTAINLAIGCDDIHIVKPYFGSDVDTPINDLGATSLFVEQDRKRYARVSLSAVQDTATGVAEDIIWNVEDVDVGGWFSSPSTDLVVPSNLGIRKVSIQVNIKWGNNSTGIRQIVLLKNNVGFDGAAELIASAQSTTKQNMTSGVIEVVDGDTFKIRVLQDSGVVQNVLSDIATWFSIEAVD